MRLASCKVPLASCKAHLRMSAQRCPHSYISHYQVFLLPRTNRRTQTGQRSATAYNQKCKEKPRQASLTLAASLPQLSIPEHMSPNLTAVRSLRRESVRETRLHSSRKNDRCFDNTRFQKSARSASMSTVLSEHKQLTSLTSSFHRQKSDTTFFFRCSSP